MEALKNVDAIVDVDTKFDAVTIPSNNPLPATENCVVGEDVPIPTLPSSCVIEVLVKKLVSVLVEVVAVDAVNVSPDIPSCLITT